MNNVLSVWCQNPKPRNIVSTTTGKQKEVYLFLGERYVGYVYVYLPAMEGRMGTFSLSLDLSLFPLIICYIVGMYA